MKALKKKKNNFHPVKKAIDHIKLCYFFFFRTEDIKLQHKVSFYGQAMNCVLKQRLTLKIQTSPG